MRSPFLFALLAAEPIVNDLKLYRMCHVVHHRIRDDNEDEVRDEGKNVDVSEAKHIEAHSNDDGDKSEEEERRHEEIAAEDADRIGSGGVIGFDRVNIPINEGDDRFDDADSEKNGGKSDNDRRDKHEPINSENIGGRLKKEVVGIGEKLGEAVREPTRASDSYGRAQHQNAHRKKRNIAEELQNMKFYKIRFVVLHKWDSSFVRI